MLQLIHPATARQRTENVDLFSSLVFPLLKGSEKQRDT